jgi:hypothetical protein
MTHRATISELRDHLQAHHHLEGDWVAKSSHYEDDFAASIGAVPTMERQWDCVWNGLPIEVKKGKNHAWVNLVRYAEYLLNREELPIVTLFLLYSGKRILFIYGLSMPSLIAALGLDQMKARAVLDVNSQSRHPLNVQAILTKSDIEDAADFEIPC